MRELCIFRVIPINTGFSNREDIDRPVHDPEFNLRPAALLINSMAFPYVLSLCFIRRVQLSAVLAEGYGLFVARS